MVGTLFFFTSLFAWFFFRTALESTLHLCGIPHHYHSRSVPCRRRRRRCRRHLRGRARRRSCRRAWKSVCLSRCSSAVFPVRPSFLPSFLPSSPCFDVDPTEPYLSSSPLSLRLRGRRGGEREGGEKGGSSRGERGKEKKTSRKIPPQKSLTLCSIREGKRGQKKSVLGATCSLHLIKHSIRVGRPFFRSRCSPFAAAAAATAAVVSPSGSAVAFTAVFPTERERERRERREEALFLPPRHSSSSFLLQ